MPWGALGVRPYMIMVWIWLWVKNTGYLKKPGLVKGKKTHSPVVPKGVPFLQVVQKDLQLVIVHAFHH